MSSSPQTFIAIENSLFEVLLDGWSKQYSKIKKKLATAMAVSDIKTITDLISSIDLALIFDENTDVMELATYSAFFFGVGRHGDAAKSQVIAQGTRPEELPYAVEQLRSLLVVMSEQVKNEILRAIVTYTMENTQKEESRVQLVTKETEPLQSFQSFIEKELWEFTKGNLQMLASLHTSRLAQYGFVVEADLLGVTQYVINAFLDSRTCPVCSTMSGKVFTVTSVKDRLRQAITTTDPEMLALLNPFPSKSKKHIEKLKSMSSADMVAAGFNSPPYHPKCRCYIDAVTSETVIPKDLVATGPDGNSLTDVTGNTPHNTDKPKPAPKPKETPKKKKGWPEDEDLSYVQNSQKGSNLGGLYTDKDGNQYYAKFYTDPDQAKSEHLAFKLYKELGVSVPESRIMELTDPNGRKRTAIITKWNHNLKALDPLDLSSMNQSELARIYQASVLTKNWDVVGLGFDNIMLDTVTGKFIVMDCGGSFKFRAQGGSKPYYEDLAELKSLLTTRDSNGKLVPAAQVFSTMLKQNVFLEKEGALRLVFLEDKVLENLLQDADITGDLAKELLAGLRGRRDQLIDRYDLRGERTPEGFGKYYNYFVENLPKGQVKTELMYNGSLRGNNYKLEQLEIILMEAHAKEIHPNLVTTMKTVYDDWSSDSSKESAAYIKQWVKDQFGHDILFHDYKTTPAEIANAIAKSKTQAAEKLKRKVYKPEEEVETLFMDAIAFEYEFTQYELRRVHGWDDVIVARGMKSSEYQKLFTPHNVADKNQTVGTKGTFTNNAATSTSVDPGAWGAEAKLSVTAKVENIMKTYHEGKAYMKYGSHEAEYVLIGGTYPATVINPEKTY